MFGGPFVIICHNGLKYTDKPGWSTVGTTQYFEQGELLLTFFGRCGGFHWMSRKGLVDATNLKFYAALKVVRIS